MNVKLVVVKAEGLTCGDAVELGCAETVVGRHRDCQLRIPSADVSRRHCILRITPTCEGGDTGGVLTVEDLGSMNGTYVNRERVMGSRTVRAGDQLEIGPVLFAVEVGETAVAAPNAETVKVAAAGAEDTATVDVKPAGSKSALELLDAELDQAASATHHEKTTQLG